MAMKHWPAVIIASLVCVIAMLFIIGPGLAHDHWISREKLTDPVTSQWCCDEKDTREENDNVRAVPGGYLIISTGEIIAKERVIWRSPGGWWRSRNLSDGSTRCLIGPPQGS